MTAARTLPRGRRASAPAAAFTLVEVLIGATISAVVLTAVLSSFIFLGRTLARLANYHSLEAKAREAVTYLSRDLALARSVKSGTTPDATSLTLALPSGDVTYTYSAATQTLRRQATFGASTDIKLLASGHSVCTAFEFEYFTAAGGSPTSQVTAGVVIPYSIKQVQFRFTLASPTSFSDVTRASYEAVSSRYVVRNRQLPDGT